jgi:hypothetical protein
MKKSYFPVRPVWSSTGQPSPPQFDIPMTRVFDVMSRPSVFRWPEPSGGRPLSDQARSSLNRPLAEELKTFTRTLLSRKSASLNAGCSAGEHGAAIVLNDRFKKNFGTRLPSSLKLGLRK